MKILLINPPSTNEILSCNPEIIKTERGFDPPLGLLYIAGYLKKYSDHQLKIIDAQIEKLTYSQLKSEIKNYCPDIVGISAMTFTLLDVIKTINAAKSACPNSKIVIGGVHPLIYPNESINLAGVDFLVLGEGEKTFLDLVNNFYNYEKLKSIPGLVFKKNGELINTGVVPFITNLDELPFPARELTPYKKYFSLLAKKDPITTMFTSRGCPYKCIFCDRPTMGKNFRARSAKNVVDEMEHCLKLGINEIFIYDDTFTVNQKRVIEICEEILKRKLKFNWDIRARVNTVNEQMLKLLKKAGCQRIHYGVEAGTDKILKVLKKNITLEQTLHAFKITRQAGIDTLAYFMIGAPTETKEDILETIRFAKKLKPDYVQITLLTPFPATELYQKTLDEGIFESDYWREFARNPQPGFVTKYWTKELALNEINELLSHAYKQFYLRPSYIAKRIFKIRSSKELLRKIKAGFKVLTMKK